KGGRSDGCIVGAGGVQQKRHRANGRIFESVARSLISDVEKERPRADTGVPAAVCVAKERKPAKCSIRHAGGDVSKGVGAVPRVERTAYSSWIWFLWSWSRWRVWQKANADNPRHNVN